MDKHDAVSRKNAPMARGLLDYFPDALAEVAEVSRVGSEQHQLAVQHCSIGHVALKLKHVVRYAPVAGRTTGHGCEPLVD